MTRHEWGEFIHCISWGVLLPNANRAVEAPETFLLKVLWYRRFTLTKLWQTVWKLATDIWEMIGRWKFQKSVSWRVLKICSLSLIEKTLACCEGSFVRGRQARRWINRSPNQGNVVCLAMTAFFAENHALCSWIWTPIFNWGPIRWEVSLQQSGTAASVCFGLHHAFRILSPDVMNEETKSKAHLHSTWDQTQATARTPWVPSQKDSMGSVSSSYDGMNYTISSRF